MIHLSVHALRGHYGYPGRVPTMGLRQTAPVPFPTTVKGFLESMCGDPPGCFSGKFAYGQLHEPGGRGKVTQYDHTINTSGKPQPKPSHWEVLVGVAYQVVVDGDYEDRIRASLGGEVSRFGVLSLGTSDDEVWEIQEAQEPARWVVPGKKYPLIIRAGTSYKERTPKYRKFDLTDFQEVVPDSAWMT